MTIKLARSSKEELRIFGIQLEDIPVEDLIEYAIDSCITENKAILANVNAHAMNLAYELPQFRQFLMDADVVFCDGFGVKWGSRILSHKVRYRYTPPDWIGRLCEELGANNLSLYLLGAQPGIAELAAEKLMHAHEGLSIVGTHHGYFNRDVDSEENQQIVDEINRLRPNVIILGFGMPLQEYWLMENWSNLHVNVALPAGALLDYVAESVPRAPRWMTDHGFEWLGRLIVEPRRLWRRYIIGNPLFFWRVLMQRFGLIKFHDISLD